MIIITELPEKRDRYRRGLKEGNSLNGLKKEGKGEKGTKEGREKIQCSLEGCKECIYI